MHEKAMMDYAGDHLRVIDLVRATGRFETPAELASAIEGRLMAPGSPLRVMRVKDKFTSPRDGCVVRIERCVPHLRKLHVIARARDGFIYACRYRDLLLNVALASDDPATAHVGELQLHLRAILDLKETAHVAYGIGRGLDLHGLASGSLRTLTRCSATL